MPNASKDLCLNHSFVWAGFGGYLAAVTFGVTILEVSWLHPKLFPTASLTAASLWGGLLMIIPLWFVTQQVALLVLRGILLPFGLPEKLTLSSTDVRLSGRGKNLVLRWPDIRTVRTSSKSLDFSQVHSVDFDDRAGKAAATALATLAAKEWTLAFIGPEGMEISVSSDGFKRPIRRAEPRLRAFISERLGVTLKPFSEDQEFEFPP